MTKHFSGSLCATSLLAAAIVLSCSEASAPPSQSGSAGHLNSAGLGGGAGSLSPGPVAPSSNGGAAGSAAGGGAGGKVDGGAATSGMGGSLGNAGSGGLPPYVPPVSSVICAPPHLGGTEVDIADFEEGLDILGVDGRGGIWFGYSDGTGTQTDNPIPVVDSDAGGQAMHVTGGGFTNWGSGIGSAIAFDFQKNAQCPYDASAFSGVRLKVKGSGSVRLRVAQVATTPATASDRKGTCDPNRAVCDGHHEVTILLTASWTEHQYEWSDFKQVFGQLVDFDTKAIIGLSFEFNSNTTYDAWIDDVAFTRAGEGGSGAGGAGAGGENAGGAVAD